MSTPLPPSFNILTALSGWHARRPSNAPASALWIYNPTIPRTSPDEQEEMIRVLVEHFYRCLSPRYVALLRAEAAGLPPSGALRLFGDHLDDWIPAEFFR